MLVAILMATGIITCLLGFKLFRLVLPLLGLVAGTSMGFVGFQGIFGTGTVSTTVAIFVALAFGLVMAVLSFVFFELAVRIYTALLGASAFSYLGIALGLGDNGFILFLLSVTGFIVGLQVASSPTFSTSLVITLTSLSGVALILASVFLVSGELSVEDLNKQGVVRSVIDVVDQSFLWLLVWIGGSLFATQLQYKMLVLEVLNNSYQYQAKSAK